MAQGRRIQLPNSCNLPPRPLSLLHRSLANLQRSKKCSHTEQDALTRLRQLSSRLVHLFIWLQRDRLLLPKPLYTLSSLPISATSSFIIVAGLHEPKMSLSNKERLYLNPTKKPGGIPRVASAEKNELWQACGQSIMEQGHNM